ncbi:XdhC family protein [Streptomyces sp. NPDC087525]|uniref:XdhC family protein n=1 Tax=Streptomyces sp. NPDC087525 TaxID=3365793 RepID=UPI003813FEB4
MCSAWRSLIRPGRAADLQLTSLRSPIGLDLGARTPEETAVSITGRDHRARQRGERTAAVAAHRAHPSFRCRGDTSYRKHLDRMIPHHVR